LSKFFSVFFFVENFLFVLYRDIPIEKRNNFILETGKITVPVDSELFNVGFQSSSDVLSNGNFWVHERCIKWSLGDSEKINNYDLIRTTILNAAKEVYPIFLLQSK